MQKKNKNKSKVRRDIHESRIKMGERVVPKKTLYSRKGKNKFNKKDFSNE